MQSTTTTSPTPKSKNNADLRLSEYKELYQKSKDTYSSEIDKFKMYRAQYEGTRQMDTGEPASIVWNFSYELINSTISSKIPPVKVKPRRLTERHIRNARIIEDLCRNEIDRLPFEYMNDEDERNCKIDGGSGFLVEWDNSQKTQNTVGELNIRTLQANQIIPQQAVYYTHYMDYIFVTFNDTKARIKSKYGKTVEGEGIDVTENFSYDDNGELGATDDIVTQVVCYYVNPKGSIGCISWAGDTILIDDESYEERKETVCAKCGRTEAETEIYFASEIQNKNKKKIKKKTCVCGASEWEKRSKDSETVYEDIILSDGRVIYEGTKIPYYYPRKFPLVIRKNISKSSQFIGISDCGVIHDLQQMANKIFSKAYKKALKAGSYLAKPKSLNIELNDSDVNPINITNPAELQMLRAIVIDFIPEKDLSFLNRIYEMAKSLLRITNSYQGKSDSTALSGRAKEAQIQQSVQNQVPPLVMKSAAYADIYELIFKFALAYMDEPRSYLGSDTNGKPVERVFNKYDFLEQDEAGNWYYDDGYLFSVDESGIDADNKQMMLADVRMDFSMGAYGNPSDPETMLLYWKEKDIIGYPNAKRNVEHWENKVAEAQKQAQSVSTYVTREVADNEMQNLQR